MAPGREFVNKQSKPGLVLKSFQDDYREIRMDLRVRMIFELSRQKKPCYFFI